MHHVDVHTPLCVPSSPLLPPVDTVIVDQGYASSQRRALYGTRLLCYVTAVACIFLDASHSRSFVHDPHVIETAAPVQ